MKLLLQLSRCLLFCIILLFFGSKCDMSVKNNNLPSLSFGEIMGRAESEGWKSISKNVWFSPFRNITFDAICRASYPITWKFNGFITPERIVQIRPFTRQIINENTSVFEGKIILFFNDADNCSSSLKISCESISESNVSTSFAVFVPSDTILVNSGKNVTITDSLTIPCPTTNPTVNVTLFLDTDNAFVEFLNFTEYDPVQGFILHKPTAGRFMCKVQNFDYTDTTITSVVTSIYQYNVTDHYYPRERLLSNFVSQKIYISCESSYPISIRYKGELNVTYIIKTLRKKQFYLTDEYSSVGDIWCKRKNGTEIARWRYDFVEPPPLYLDNYEGDVECLTSESRRLISLVHCRNPSDCDFMRRCFDDSGTCNYKKQTFIQSSDHQHCAVLEAETNLDEPQLFMENCVLAPFSYLSAIVECKVGEAGLTKYFEFFTSLNFLRYSRWQDAPKSELIRMDEINDVLYTNLSCKFVCTATAFIFADSITFSIEYENGSKSFHNQSQNKIRNRAKGKIHEFNILGQLNVFLPIDAVAVICHAPWWNSSEFMDTERRFKMKHLIKPSINQTEASLIFSEGESEQLVCAVNGEPKVSYEWLFGNQTLEVLEECQIVLGPNGESILQFYKVTNLIAGKYTCKASNYLDSVEIDFHVVVNEVVDIKSQITLALVISLTAIVFIVIILGFVIQQYQSVKNRLRALSADEYNEFYKGSADGFIKPTAQTLNMFPYDTSYEIPFKDISLSSMILGSGEFAYVVKGCVSPLNTEVAVKISKTDTDVSNFKAMLSELKIYIYVGNHDNVVKLIGACTENIRDRSLHILLELNEYGSLEKYLRKYKSNFINVFKNLQNNSMDSAVLHDNSSSCDTSDDSISTLHLLKWSMQIASGMEFLSDKSIVHADLALRNVLLNSQKVAKISDFGLSRQLYESTNYVKKTKVKLPFRWMSLESLKTLTFSTESDVWSFGVAMWEMYTLGQTPFSNEVWNNEFISRLESGMRMGRPKYSNAEIFFTIMTCWEEEPKFRPTFTSLKLYFLQMLKQIDSKLNTCYMFMH